MKIEIAIEPYNLGGSNLRLSYRVEVHGEIFAFDEIMKDDWFTDKSIFRRITEDATYRLQKLYNDKIGKSPNAD
jgi:hypothetical protein